MLGARLGMGGRRPLSKRLQYFILGDILAMGCPAFCCCIRLRGLSIASFLSSRRSSGFAASLANARSARTTPFRPLPRKFSVFTSLQDTGFQGPDQWQSRKMVVAGWLQDTNKDVGKAVRTHIFPHASRMRPFIALSLLTLLFQADWHSGRMHENESR